MYKDDPQHASLGHCLTQFWDFESMGIMREESSAHEKFIQQIKFDGQRYYM